MERSQMTSAMPRLTRVRIGLSIQKTKTVSLTIFVLRLLFPTFSVRASSALFVVP